jgi:hypothetical protein
LPSCGVIFQARSASARFCSPAHRARFHREKASEVEDFDDGPQLFEIHTRTELERLGTLETMLGQQALTISRAMARETGSPLASLSREHSRLMTAVGSPPAGLDSLDEIAKRRAAKERRAQGEP